MAPSRSVSGGEAISEKENGVKSKAREEVSTRRTSNFEDTMFEMEAMLNEHTFVPGITEDVRIDIVECSRSVQAHKIKDDEDDADATEISSSFDHTVSSEKIHDYASEPEVESSFLANDSVQQTFSSVSPTRKKKLTTEWRNYIRPLMWRCKWTELRLKQMEIQTLKYDREIAAMDESKQYEHVLKNHCSKDFPYSGEYKGRKVLKRRKRRRIEDTAITSAYMSRHNLFSYFETRRSDHDGASTAEDFWNPVVTQHKENAGEKFGKNRDKWFFECKDEGDASFEKFLWNLDTVQGRIQRLRDDLELLITKNASRIPWDFPVPVHPSSPDDNNNNPLDPIIYYDLIHDIIGTPANLLIDDSSDDMVDIALVDNVGRGASTSSEQVSLRTCLALSSLRFPKNKRKRADRRPRLRAWTQFMPTNLDATP